MIEGIYIHIPFCEQKCRYCDFLSFSQKNAQHQAEYVQALIQEMDLTKTLGHSEPKTVFIGGGTPTSLSETVLEQLLQAIQRLYVSFNLVEYTIEMNPGTVTKDKLQMMKHYGVNRLSMGVQSDQDVVLQQLGRIHNFKHVVESYRLARDVGFANINFDLIYGLPLQTLVQWQATLDNIMMLKPDHLSLYQLKIEENTVFHQWLQEGKIAEFDDELAFQMYETAREQLARQGYDQYEISNYAQNGKESVHNQLYWCTSNYLGLGMGAHSFISPVRYFNTSYWQQYVVPLTKGTLPERTQTLLSGQEAMEETVFMGLRMNQGISLAKFQARYQRSVTEVFPEAIAKCQEKGWLVLEEGYMKLTEQGRVLGNMVFMEFI